MSRRAQDWRRAFRALFEASGVVMGAWYFITGFGWKAFAMAIGVGAFLAPIETE